MKLHKNFYVAIAFLIISFICMLFLTTTSPLYSVTPTSDGQVMFTVGKGLLHGLMPYKDLFDQRGPLIYLMNSIAALISYKSLLGIYVFESLALFIDLFLIYKILNLKYSTKLSILSSFTIIPFAFNSSIFIFGDLPEEFMLPMIFATIYLLTRKSINDWDKFEYMMMGLFASIAFWVKFPMTVTWIAVYLVLVIYFIYRKSWKQLFHSILYGIVGFLPVTLFITILYGLKHALGSLYYVYFYLNMTSYNPPVVVAPAFTRSYVIVALVFLIIYIQEYELSRLSWLVLSAIVVLNYAYLWKFGWLNYYYELFVFVFLIVPVILCMFFNNYKLFSKLIYIVPILTLLGIYVTNKNFTNYSTLSGSASSVRFVDASGKSKTPIMKEFASIINKSKDKTVLMYNRLDDGVYTYSGVTPRNKYFIRNNVNYAPMLNAQKHYLNSKKFKFVSIVNYYTYDHGRLMEGVSDDNYVLRHDYKKVATRKSYVSNGNSFREYILYERKD